MALPSPIASLFPSLSSPSQVLEPAVESPLDLPRYMAEELAETALKTIRERYGRCVPLCWSIIPLVYDITHVYVSGTLILGPQRAAAT
jgi:hypothetical protein